MSAGPRALARRVIRRATRVTGPAGRLGRAVRHGRRRWIQARFDLGRRRGAALDVVVTRAVRALAETGDWDDWNAGWVIAETARVTPRGEQAADLGQAILLHRRHQLRRAWKAIEGHDLRTLARLVPLETADAGLAENTEASRRTAIGIADAGIPLAAATRVELAGRYLAFGERSHAADLVTGLRSSGARGLGAPFRRSLASLEDALGPGPSGGPPGSVMIGLLRERRLEPSSSAGDLGDSIESLAALGNVVRHAAVAFSGEDGLGELAARLQARVRPDLRLDGPAAAVHLVPVDRGFSSVTEVQPDTWVVAFGSHVEPLYGLRHDFPYHPNVRPLFASFHVASPEVLDEAALEYLRRHGPIGCRDWTTTFQLLSAGVDAFFSGCLTTTLDGLYPAREDVRRGRGRVGIIDLPNADVPDGIRIRHQSAALGSVPFGRGLELADEALAGYQCDLDQAVTGQLHAYLPLTAIGIPVELRSSTMGDPRFAGLVGLRPADARLEAMRAGLRAVLGPTLARVVAGDAPEAVYETWRELTLPLVAEARRRFEAPVQAEGTDLDVDSLVATVHAASRHSGPELPAEQAGVADVALSFDQNLLLPAAVLVESIVANASGPVRVWILSRGVPGSYQAWLGRAFPGVPITFLPCDRVGYGPTGRPRRVPRRITVSTMDRLLLPALLPSVGRIAYLDVDTLMVGDVHELLRVDLVDHPIGARDSIVSEVSEWLRAGLRLPEPEALELRRTMGLRHGFGQPALNAGVIVMDLDRMRRDGFVRWAFGIVERFGLHDQDTMLAYVGPERARIDGRWNAMPVLEDVSDPKLIHWASFGKPWDPPITFAKDAWQAHADRLAARAGPPPG